MSLNHFRRTAYMIAFLLPITVSHVGAQQGAPTQMPQGAQAAQQQISAVEDNSSLSRDAKAKQLVAIVASAEKQQRAVLDPTQQKLFDDQKAKNEAADTFHLTPLQKALIQLIQGEVTKQMQAVGSNTSMGLDARAATLEKLMASSKHELRSILTPAQLKLVTDNDSKQQAADSKSDPLHLTLHQRIEQQLIQQDFYKLAGSIYEDKSLSKDQKQAKMEALGKTTRASQEAVLTPQQRATEVSLIAQQHKSGQ